MGLFPQGQLLLITLIAVVESLFLLEVPLLFEFEGLVEVLFRCIQLFDEFLGFLLLLAELSFVLSSFFLGLLSPILSLFGRLTLLLVQPIPSLLRPFLLTPRLKGTLNLPLSDLPEFDHFLFLSLLEELTLLEPAKHFVLERSSVAEFFFVFEIHKLFILKQLPFFDFLAPLALQLDLHPQLLLLLENALDFSRGLRLARLFLGFSQSLLLLF